MSLIDAIIVTVIGGVITGVILLWLEHRTGFFRDRAQPASPSR